MNADDAERRPAEGQPTTVGYHLVSCASTQPVARAWVASPDLDPAAQAVAVLTDEQVHGLGRHGRVWQDGPGTNLLLSVGVRGPLHAGILDGLAARLAHVVAGVLHSHAGVPVHVDAPNDLVADDGAKLGGVLVDTRSTGAVVHELAVGVGANLSGDPFEVDSRAATTLEALGGQVTLHPRELASQLVPLLGDAVGIELAAVRWRQPARLWRVLR